MAVTMAEPCLGGLLYIGLMTCKLHIAGLHEHKADHKQSGHS